MIRLPGWRIRRAARTYRAARHGHLGRTLLRRALWPAPVPPKRRRRQHGR